MGFLNGRLNERIFRIENAIKVKYVKANTASYSVSMILWIKLHSHGIAIVCNLFGVIRMERWSYFRVSSEIKCLIKRHDYLLLFIWTFFFLVDCSFFVLFCFFFFLHSFALCFCGTMNEGDVGTFDFFNLLLSYFLFIFACDIFFQLANFFAQIFRKAICFDFKFNFPNKLAHFVSFYYLYSLASFDMQDHSRPLTCPFINI